MELSLKTRSTLNRCFSGPKVGAGDIPSSIIFRSYFQPSAPTFVAAVNLLIGRMLDAVSFHLWRNDCLGDLLVYTHQELQITSILRVPANSRSVLSA
jgi:hypothetical protein